MPLDDAGFEVVASVLTADETEALLAALATVPRGRAGARNLLTLDAVARIADDKRVSGLAQAALEAPAIPFKATLFDKTPAANWLVAWHQDTALPLESRRDAPGWGPWSVKASVLHARAPASVLRDIVAVRLHLDDSTAENGPLRVVPGSHREGVLSQSSLSELVSREDAHECRVPRGGALVMRPLLVHASSRAVVARPRRVLHFEYARTLEVGHGLRLRRLVPPAGQSRVQAERVDTSHRPG